MLLEWQEVLYVVEGYHAKLVPEQLLEQRLDC